MRDIKTRLLILGAISCGVALAADNRSGRRIESGAGGSSFKSPCGSANEVARRGGDCLVPIFELIEGRFPQPQTDADIILSCNRFNNTSRCVRQLAKDCLTGVHKTSVGAVASATRRFYTNECKSQETRAPYLEPMKCALVNGPQMKKLYQTYTGYMQGVRDLPVQADEKITKMCCILNEIDEEIAKIFDKNCASLRPTVLKLVHAVTDDARNTLCLNPRCKGALDKVRGHKYTPPQNLIEPIQQILYQMIV